MSFCQWIKAVVIQSPLRSLFAALTIALSIFASRHYPGDVRVYLLFSFCFNLLLLKGFSPSSFFSESFISVLMWLGFWMKLTAHLLMENMNFSEAIGSFDKSGPAFDQVLFISSVGALGFLVGFYINDRIFKKRPQEYLKDSGRPPKSYLKLRKFIFPLFLLSVVVLCVANLHFGIYQKGTLPKTHPPAPVKVLVTWLLLTGFACLSATLLHWDIRSRISSLTGVFVSLLESLFSTLSLLSRGFILNTIPQIWSYFRVTDTGNAKLSLLKKGLVLFSFFSLFAFSVVAVNALRLKFFFQVDMSNTSEVASGLKSSTGALIFDRWVGLEGVMSVASYDQLGWSLLKEVLQERGIGTGKNIYDSRIGKTRYTEDQISRQNIITLPGLVAFLFYPGSWLFLFLSLIIVTVFGVFLEFLVLRSTSNLILAALFGESLAYRYAHFGHSVHQSHLYFIAFGGTVFVIALIQRFYFTHED